jgi:putative methionine-R-sulfoxide reductase with GAF domain
MYTLESDFRLMAAILQVPRSATPNRRSRVRQKVHVPAYANILGASSNELLDLYEVLDLSERGAALQCSLPLAVDQIVELTLSLAEASGQISASARVAWVDSVGRVGLAFLRLEESAVRQLQEWLFLNAIAAAAYAAAPAQPTQDPQNFAPRQNYTDLLSAAAAVEREVETLGTDFEAILLLIASRARSLLRASGAAIALAGKDAGTMICSASAGESAPPVGAALQVGSGFSGECVRTGKLLRCEDTETDERVDRQSCRALGVRSIMAAPVRMEEKAIGLLEVFSADPGAFRESDGDVLQRFAEMILAAISRTGRAYDPSQSSPVPPKPYSPSPGSVLFAHMPDETAETEDVSEHPDNLGGIRLPRSHLFLLIATAATIAMVLGFISASPIQPWIQEKLHSRERGGEQTVLASSKPPLDPSSSSGTRLSADSANLPQLRELAGRDDPAAENALGLLYAQGDEKQAVKQDEKEAARWFTRAAEHGNVSAQSKLGSLYLSGRGVPQDPHQAYFWTVVALARGDSASKVLAPFIATRLTLPQRAAVEQKAEQWLQQHESSTKASR